MESGGAVGITDRRKRPPPDQRPAQPALALTGQSGAHIVAFVVGPGPGRHKRGPVGRKLEQVQAEIVAHYHNRLPPELVHINALHRAINKRRKKRGLGMVGRMTVKRALRTLRDKNS